MQPTQPRDLPKPSRRRVNGLSIIAQWFGRPFDYLWVLESPTTLSIRVLIKSVFGAGSLLFAFASFAMLFSPDGPRAGFATLWTVAMAICAVIVSIYWFVGPMPSRRVIIAFALFADFGLASVLAVYEDPYVSLVGCALFVISGAFCTYFVSPRWLVAHLVFACVVIEYFSVTVNLAGRMHVATLIAANIVLLGAVAGVPLFAHIAWTTLSHDARQSAQDPLTGLYNRRGWDNAVDELWERGSDQLRSMAVLLIDIDSFKSVNDQYGHHEGDRVIELMARRLEDLIGGDGLIARTGGEEFLAAVITGKAEIDRLIDSIVHVLHDDGDRVPVTASVGVAVVDAESPLWSDGVGTVLRASRVADSMMYEAKEAGGNQVVTVMM